MLTSIILVQFQSNTLLVLRFWLIFETFQKSPEFLASSLKRLLDLAIWEDFRLFLKVCGHFSKSYTWLPKFWTKLFYFLIFQVTISKKSKLWWNRIAPNSKIDFPKMNLFLAKATTQLFIFTFMTLNPLCGSLFPFLSIRNWIYSSFSLLSQRKYNYNFPNLRIYSLIYH